MFSLWKNKLLSLPFSKFLWKGNTKLSFIFKFRKSVCYNHVSSQIIEVTYIFYDTIARAANIINKAVTKCTSLNMHMQTNMHNYGN